MINKLPPTASWQYCGLLGSFLSTHGDGGLGEGGGGGGDGGGGDGGGAFDGAVGLARHDLGIIPTPGPELGSGATLAA